MGDQACTAFTAIVTSTITDQALPLALESAQADTDLAAIADQACTSAMDFADQLDRLVPVRGGGQPSASSEQKASHFFRSASETAISAMAFSLQCSSLCSFKVSTGFSLAPGRPFANVPPAPGTAPAHDSRR